MPLTPTDSRQHRHDFSALHAQGEKRTTQVLLLTAVTMVVEVVAGSVYGSMALLADGWHMGTHVAAFMIAVFTYRYARRHADSPAFSFGTGKVGVLGGFASAVTLAVVALAMFAESLQRLFEPHAIQFNEAIGVALLGLAVNLLSAFLLQDHPHHHDDSPPHHHDHNLRAAYLHVLADAVTSVLAIIALISGKYLGWVWLDPLMGMVGALVITRWAYVLLRESSPVLLDQSIEPDYREALRQVLEERAGDRVTDLHVWRVGPLHYAAVIALASPDPLAPDYYKQRLAGFERLAHVTVEVNPHHLGGLATASFRRISGPAHVGATRRP